MILHTNGRIVPWDTPQSKRLSAARGALVVGSIFLIAIAALSITGLILNHFSKTDVLKKFIILQSASTLTLIGVSATAALGILILYRWRIQLQYQLEIQAMQTWVAKQKSLHASYTFDLNPGNKPRVLILSSLGGGAHTTAAESVQAALQDRFDVQITYPDKEFGAKNWFNTCQKNGWHRLQRLLSSIQKIAEFFHAFSSICQAISNAIYTYKPHLVISVQPIVNGHTQRVTEALQIPMIQISTDCYSEHFFYGIAPINSQYYVAALSHQPEQEERQRLQNQGVYAKDIHPIGAPIRKEFLNTIDSDTSLETIDPQAQTQPKQNDKIAVLSMGAQGGQTIFQYIKYVTQYTPIIQNDGKLHIYLCCGKNTDIQNNIRSQVAQCTNVIFHVLGYQNSTNMARLMRQADVYITKPGGATVFEAEYLNTPLLLDATTAHATPWEPYNMKVMKDMELAEQSDTRSSADFHAQLNRFLAQKKQRYAHVPSWGSQNFAKNLQELIQTRFADTAPRIESNS